MIPEDLKKPLFEIGRFVATLGAFLLAAELLGLAKQSDVDRANHAQDMKLIQARARVDIIATIYQTTEGLTIFWDTLEEPEISLRESPSGPTR